MDKVIDYYSRFDEWGRLEREPIEFQVNWHFIKSEKLIITSIYHRINRGDY